MAIDKGGLDYPITSTYDPSGVNAFREDIKRLRRELADLRRAAGEIRTNLSGVRGGRRGGGTDPSAGFGFGAPITVEGQLGRLARDNARNMKVYSAEVSKANTTTTSFRNSSQALTKSMFSTSRSIEQSTRTIRDHESALSRLFVRYIAFRAVVGAIRGIVGVFKDTVGEIIRFNAQLENTTLGVASLLTAVGSVRDGLGNALTGFDALNAAQTVAAGQLVKLRAESLRTAASFEQLAQTFQVAIAPGLRAGFDVSQIREFTVAISQAAAAIALPQNQLAEEIRSILSGTINLRSTRIAVALGITNADIARAKEMGNLAEFLRVKFAAFNIAAAESGKNFDVVVGNLKSGLSQLIGTGGKSLFDAVKQSIMDMRNSLIQVDQITGEIRLNPELVTAATELGDALATAYKSLVDFISTITGVSSLAEALRAISTNIRLIAPSLEAAKGPMGAMLTGFGKLANLIRLSTVGIALMGVKAAQIFVDLSDRLNKSLGIDDKGAAAADVKALQAELDALFKIGQAAEADLLGNKRGELPFETFNTGATKAIGHFGELENAIQAMNAPLEKTLKLMDTLDDNIAETRLDLKQSGLEQGDRPFGLSGADKTQFGIVQKSLRERLKALKEISAAQTESEDALIRLTKSQEAQAAAVDKMSTAEQNAFSKGFEIGKRRLDLEAQLHTASSERAVLQVRINEANATPEKAGQDLLRRRSELESYMRKLREQIDLQIQASNTVTSPLAEESQKRVLGAVAKNLETSRAIVLEQEKLNEHKKREFEVTRRINGEAALKLQIAIQEAKVRLQQDAPRIENDMRAAQRNLEVFKLEQQGDNRFRLAGQQAEVQGVLDNLSTERDILIETNAARQQALDMMIKEQQLNLNNINSALETATSEREKAQLKQEQVDLERTIQGLQEQGVLAQDNHVMRLETINAQLQIAIDKQQELNFIASQPITAGITIALRDLNKNLPTEFEFTKDIITKTVNDLSTTISDAIVDAFDPTNKKSLRERFSQFLKGIAQEIIQMLVKVAVVKSTLAIFGGALGGGAGFNEGGSVGFAEGGRIKSRHRKRPTPFHANAPGRAGGGWGGFRPGGLDPSDTVPIWAAVGEWIIKAKFVAKYGHDVMSAINDGIADPAALRAVTTQRKGYVPPAGGPGFASGGKIDRTSAGAAGSTPSPAIALVAPTEENMERMLRGGENAYFSFVEANASKYRAVLGIR